MFHQKNTTSSPGRSFKKTVGSIVVTLFTIIAFVLFVIWLVYPTTQQIMFKNPISTEKLFSLTSQHKVGVFMLYTAYKLGTETFTEMKLFSPDQAYDVASFNHAEFQRDLIESRKNAIAGFNDSREQVLNPPSSTSRSDEWQKDLENWYNQIDSPPQSITDTRATGVIFIGHHWDIWALRQDLLPITGDLSKRL